jgi:glycosyltransferase involved in cell wall biosynthesis
MVSCIMPTRDRRSFVKQAIHYFQRQDYESRELVIVDDGNDSVADLATDDPRIRYTRCSTRMTIGAKRNIACEEARGQVVVHWDDDDWMAPWRLTYQVGQLLANDVEICGLDRVWFFDPVAGRAWQYIYPRSRRAWLYGATFCYRMRLWQRRPFANTNIGEDNRFVMSVNSSHSLQLENEEFCIAVIHRRNTSTKRSSGRRWQTRSMSHLDGILGEDKKFYERLGGPHESECLRQ